MVRLAAHRVGREPGRGRPVIRVDAHTVVIDGQHVVELDEPLQVEP